MNKEKIEKFWEDHKEEIIGGILILGSVLIIGGSIHSASKASKKALESMEADIIKRSEQALKVWEESKIELRDIGAVFEDGANPWVLPVATREVVEKFLDQGDTYSLDILKGMRNGKQETIRVILIENK